jgi:CelD/BcsL family acetyltransferase involved in cellulose biosynthesis
MCPIRRHQESTGPRQMAGYRLGLRGVLHITLTPIDDFDSLGRRWQALEAAADGGFFRSWTFLGCQVETRFAGARLLCATRDGQDVALAMIGARGGRYWLNQTGDAVADSVFIEHNGLLIRRGEEGVIAAVLQFARQLAAPLVLSGIDTTMLDVVRAAGWYGLQQTRFAPCVEIGGLQKPYLDTLSANARAQIRRSMRLYGEDLAVATASSLEQALSWFTEMVVLHQVIWRQRGARGAFAESAIVDFHRALIVRAWPDAGVDLLRVTAGGGTVGILYNFLKDGRVSLYQSGFAYGEDARLKPGMVCHTLAIEAYVKRGVRVYDFLGGADRYKKTLSNAGEDLHWATLHKPWSRHGLMAKVFYFFSPEKKFSLPIAPRSPHAPPARNPRTPSQPAIYPPDTTTPRSPAA